MNILTMMQHEEDPVYLSLFFTAVRPQGRVPSLPTYPPTFFFPSGLSQTVAGGYLYLVYRNGVVGYGRIAKVTQHYDGHVDHNTEREDHLADAAVLEGPLSVMPFSVWCRGFKGARYLRQALHQLDAATAQQVINGLGLGKRVRANAQQQHWGTDAHEYVF